MLYVAVVFCNAALSLLLTLESIVFVRIIGVKGMTLAYLQLFFLSFFSRIDSLICNELLFSGLTA